MKLSIALSFLLSANVVVDAFQPSTKTTTSLRSSTTTRLNAIAMDPKTTLGQLFNRNANSNNNNDQQQNNNNQDDDDDDKSAITIDMTGVALSGLQGQALKWTNEDFPEARELRAVIPEECFEPDTATSLGYLSVSVVGTALCTMIGANLLNVLPPENLLTAPFWLVYSAITGTVAMGLWVLAHECGHGAFSKNKTIQDTVGYVLHSIFLVPYYSWQRSHAVHHQYTNHMELGETHVPEPMEKDGEEGSLALRKSFLTTFGETLGIRVWGAYQSFLHLIVGWPAYLLIGATGGSDRGMTNHYWPNPLTTPKNPKKELFPGNWKEKVYKSDVGVAAVVAAATAWAACNGLPQMMALYGGPLIVVNAWLVLYTWYVFLLSCVSSDSVNVHQLTYIFSSIPLGSNTPMSTFRTIQKTTTVLSRVPCTPLTVLMTN